MGLNIESNLINCVTNLSASNGASDPVLYILPVLSIASKVAAPIFTGKNGKSYLRTHLCHSINFD